MTHQRTEMLREQIASHSRIVIMGVGSELRGDDAAGMRLISMLNEGLSGAETLLISASTAPENFTGLIKSYSPDLLIIVDAARMGLQPGEYALISEEDISGVEFSTHMLPLSMVLAYLREECSCDTILLGIEPAGLELAEPMSREMECAVSALSCLLTRLLSAPIL